MKKLKDAIKEGLTLIFVLGMFSGIIPALLEALVEIIYHNYFI